MTQTGTGRGQTPGKKWAMGVLECGGAPPLSEGGCRRNGAEAVNARRPESARALAHSKTQAPLKVSSLAFGHILALGHSLQRSFCVSRAYFAERR